jgi:hypothetical protein
MNPATSRLWRPQHGFSRKAEEISAVVVASGYCTRGWGKWGSGTAPVRNPSSPGFSNLDFSTSFHYWLPIYRNEEHDCQLTNRHETSHGYCTHPTLYLGPSSSCEYECGERACGELRRSVQGKSIKPWDRPLSCFNPQHHLSHHNHIVIRVLRNGSVGLLGSSEERRSSC